MHFTFSSFVPTALRQDLETLVFFHPHQGKMRRDIMENVGLYGVPRIHAVEGRLTIATEKIPDAQTIFEFVDVSGSNRLAGFVLFNRVGASLFILHMAVRPVFAQGGRFERDGALFKMMEELRRIGRQLRGIESIELRGHAGRTIRIPVGGVRGKTAR